jgi:hypothetical protein
VIDKDTDPAGTAGPGDADVCAETTAGAAARYEVSG